MYSFVLLSLVCGVCGPLYTSSIPLRKPFRVADGRSLHDQQSTSPTLMWSVRCDVAPHGRVHTIAFLALLQACADGGRHAPHECKAGVGVSQRSCSLVALADEVCDPPHVSASHMHTILIFRVCIVYYYNT